VEAAWLPGIAALGLLFAGAACRTPAPSAPVPVQGSSADISALAGTWVGSYSSEDTGRRGSVTFRLRSGADTAHGEVEMTFSRSLRLYGEQQAECMGMPRKPCTTIDVAFVSVEEGKVRGELAPYWDPDCDCRARTVFEGEMAGDHIAGTFTSRRDVEAGSPVTGRWFADRRSK